MSMERIIKRVFLACSGLAVGVVLAACVWPGRYGYRSVCSVCGLEQWNSEVRLGPLEVPWGMLSSDETNAVSVILMNHPLISGHQHDWIFASGSGGGGIWFSKGAGRGRHLWQAVRSTNAAEFLKELGRSKETNSLWRWRDRLLDPKQSLDAVMAIASGEDNREEAQTWPVAAEAFFREVRELQPAERR
jgi:hypothetical protein